MSSLRLDNVCLNRDGRDILNNISLQVAKGELVALLGANGAGKSSLLRCAAGLEKNIAGSVYLNQQPVSNLSPVERARQLAYLPQKRPVAWPVRAFDVVSLGRYAYGVRIGQLQGPDLDAVNTAIKQCDLDSLKNRRMDTLSGGEAARVHCARAFAAESDLLLADEPTASLDPKHQLSLMQLIRRYVDNDKGALVVAHEANLAARFADRLVWLKHGELFAEGSVEATMTEETMAEIYGVRSKIHNEDGQINVSILDTL